MEVLPHDKINHRITVYHDRIEFKILKNKIPFKKPRILRNPHLQM